VSPESTGFLLVRAGNRRVGLQLGDVLEVVALGDVHPVPVVEPAVRGLVAVQGRMVPLTSRSFQAELALWWPWRAAGYALKSRRRSSWFGSPHCRCRLERLCRGPLAWPGTPMGWYLCSISPR
jgi:hypothetical protein